MKAITLVVLATLCAAAYADTYAVLVAGSNGFYNYRHQADVCHGYHVLLDKGNVKASNIIVMSYDDVASDPSNPFPNTLFNKPTTGAGVDVNKGCVIDYKGADVTPENYLKVLKGDSEGLAGVGTGRVLESGPNDNVFLSFYDHGGAGLIAFPSEYLYANDLLNALKDMHTNKKYSKLTYYMEACESGSMFVDLPTNLSIYGVTAANPSESSWGTYCPPDDSVNGKEIGSCLGDLFSINWMEDADIADMTQETLQQQYAKIKTETDKSHVMQYGDVTFTTKVIGDFMSTLNKVEKPKKRQSWLQEMLFGKKEEMREARRQSVNVDSRDIKMQYFVNKFLKNPTQENMFNLQAQIQQVEFFSGKFAKLQDLMSLKGLSDTSKTNFDCYKKLVNKFESTCAKFDESTFGYMKFLAEMCENVTGFGFEHVFGAVDQICAQN